MAAPLTTQQQADFDKIVSTFNDFKSALLSSVKADNDPAHNLGDARDRAAALRVSLSRLNTCLVNGGAIAGGFFMDPDTSSAFLTRDPPTRGEVKTIDTPSTTV